MLSAMSSSCDNTACAMETMHVKQDIPQSLDVILGRGKRYSKNPGNMIFQGKHEHRNNSNLFVNVRN